MGLEAIRAGLVVAVVAAGGIFSAGCGGGDDDGKSPSPTGTPAPSPNGGAAPPGHGTLPPEVLQCLKARGVDVDASDPQALLHSGAVPPQVVNDCFGALHGGGGP